MKLLDLFLLAAAALIVAGVYMFSFPAALIVAGLMVAAAWVLLDDRGL